MVVCCRSWAQTRTERDIPFSHETTGQRRRAAHVRANSAKDARAYAGRHNNIPVADGDAEDGADVWAVLHNLLALAAVVRRHRLVPKHGRHFLRPDTAMGNNEAGRKQDLGSRSSKIQQTALAA